MEGRSLRIRSCIPSGNDLAPGIARNSAVVAMAVVAADPAESGHPHSAVSGRRWLGAVSRVLGARASRILHDEPQHPANLRFAWPGGLCLPGGRSMGAADFTTAFTLDTAIEYLGTDPARIARHGGVATRGLPIAEGHRHGLRAVAHETAALPPRPE